MESHKPNPEQVFLTALLPEHNQLRICQSEQKVSDRYKICQDKCHLSWNGAVHCFIASACSAGYNIIVTSVPPIVELCNVFR